MCGVQSGVGVSHCLGDLHSDFILGASDIVCISQRRRMKAVLISCVLRLFSPHILGQQMRAGSTIAGAVTDPSESVVVGAQAILRSAATELARTQTDKLRHFRFTGGGGGAIRRGRGAAWFPCCHRYR
jgi:hypothetical protein